MAETESHTIRLLQEMRKESMQQATEIRAEINDLRSSMEERFSYLESRIDGLELKMDGITQTVIYFGGHVYRLDERVTNLEDRASTS